MTTFRLRTNGQPEIGDLLLNEDTRNVWEIQGVREVHRRVQDTKYAHTLSLDVARLDRHDRLAAAARVLVVTHGQRRHELLGDRVVWPFISDRRRR